MKAVLDANVFVSATISSHGKPAQVLDAWREGLFELILSADILEEIGEVLNRPAIRQRHRWSDAEIVRFLVGLGEWAIIAPPGPEVPAITDDPDDNRYLACAVPGGADYLVSGDQHLLTLGAFGGTWIVTPAQFLDILAGEVDSQVDGRAESAEPCSCPRRPSGSRWRGCA